MTAIITTVLTDFLRDAGVSGDKPLALELISFPGPASG